jgi:hypothetical protein
MLKMYIHRKLHRSDRLVHDDELLAQSGVFVVLAEPGAGKSDLLDYFGEHHGVSRKQATLFLYELPSNQSVLIVDALDEVARIDEVKINEIIVKAYASGASTIVFASRSYVWDEARTKVVRDYFGVEPVILRLEPFDEDEQRQLFENYLPSESFDAFKVEVDRFELTPILGNPQFLKLFADAFVESGRHFVSKLQIYEDALRRLASESQETAGSGNRPATAKIVAAASGIFAKLLLSGTAGVSAREDVGDSAYPYLRSVGPDDSIVAFTLNTRLFKPTSSVNRHEPIHRIVAEYCAADFLAKRIDDPTNTFSIKRCLAIVAPNGAVRNELRGLLGWMASLGGRGIQEAIVDLDPYTVFANGDASQLLPSSKQRLLRGLQSLAEVDPFFRRMDSWRRFNVAGFFSSDMIDHVRPLLAPAHAKSHLRGLLLELLQGTSAARGLLVEFRAIIYDPQAENIERELAYRNLDAVSKDDALKDFDILVTEGSRDALDLAAEMVLKHGMAYFGETRSLAFVKALAGLYPKDGSRERSIGSRYFIKQVVAKLDIDETRDLLDGVTANLDCVCGKDQPHRCTCRRGRSKIVGHLLDRYFEIMVGPHDYKRIAQWTKRPIFSGHVNAERHPSVETLGSDNGLRRAIQLSVFNGLSTQEDISKAFVTLYGGSAHSGLVLRQGDWLALMEHAFATENYVLWQTLTVGHSPYREPKGPDETRSRLRSQARQSREFLRIWARSERNQRERFRHQHVRFGRSGKSFKRQEEKQKEELLAHYQQHRAQIEKGRHWWWLKVFAEHYLHGANEAAEVVDDPQIVENALLNCFDFVAPDVPSLETLAESRGGVVAMVLHAACLAIFRRAGSLEGIGLNVLQAVKSDGISGNGYQEGEAARLEAELDRIVFPSDIEAASFLERFVEPQLTRSGDGATKAYILDNCSVFDRIRGRVALDWLNRFPNMPSLTRESLFGIAAVRADRAQLNALIDARCNEPVDTSEHGEKIRKFWLLRHFFFIVPTSDALWAELSADAKSIFGVEQYAGRLARYDSQGWPRLNSEQVFRVLDAFVMAWPKVDLPSSWGTGDPEDEAAYRFLTDIVFQIGQDDPSKSVPVFDRILTDPRFAEFDSAIRSLRATAVRQLALSGFVLPRPTDISRLLEESKIASVEDMRAVMVEMLDEIQATLKGAATNPVDVFYSDDGHVNENTARNRIVEMLERRLNALNLGIVIEHQMSDLTRCDITASTSVSGSQVVLVTEVKGQWNRELYTAAQAQLADRYTIYPGAADQGVYLVLWFGNRETVAGRQAPAIASAAELRREIIAQMPNSLLGRIDVYVLDLSRT